MSKNLTLLALCLAVLIASIFVIALGLMGPSMMHSLSFTRMQTSQMLTFYLVGISCSFLPIGFFTDKMGAKRIFMASLLIFALVSLAIAFTRSFTVLITLHAILGIGAGMLLNSTLTSIKQNFNDSDRTAAYAYWAGCAGIGVVLGPIISQGLLQKFSWPSIYLFNTIAFCFVALLCACFMPKSHATNQQKIISIKFFKTLCYSFWSILLFILLNQLAKAYFTYECTLLGLLTLLILFWSVKSSTIRSMFNTEYCLGVFLCMLVYFIFYCWLQSAPIWLHNNTLWGNSKIAHALLPFMILFAITPFAIGKFSKKLNNITLLFSAVIIFILSYLLWMFSDYSHATVFALMAFALTGLGCGLGNTPAAMMTMSGIRKQNSDGIQLGTLSSLRWLGGATGSTIASYLFIHHQNALMINTSLIVFFCLLSLLFLTCLRAK